MAERAYVAVMMAIVGRALVAASRVDEEIRREFAALPPGYRILMTVMPSGPSFAVEVGDDRVLRLAPPREEPPNLGVRFKHVGLAFLVFSFQEGTARAFANDRMYVDGDLAAALSLVRCLSRLEVLILPKVVAIRAVKRYPPLPLAKKLNLAGRIYALVAVNLLKGA